VPVYTKLLKNQLAVGFLLVASGLLTLLPWITLWRPAPLTADGSAPDTNIRHSTFDIRHSDPLTANGSVPDTNGDKPLPRIASRSAARAAAEEDSANPPAAPPESAAAPERFPPPLLLPSPPGSVSPIAASPPAERIRPFLEQPAAKGEFVQLSAEEPVTRTALQVRIVPEPPPPLPGAPETTEGGSPLRVPLAGAASPDAVQMKVQDGLVTIVVRDAPLGEVLALLARHEGLNLITAEEIKGRITITLTRVPIQVALQNILLVAGYSAVTRDNILLVTGAAAADRKVSSQAQGRVVQVFRLNYTAASDVNVIVKGLLSPVGQVFVSQTKENDNRKTQELLVVEDMPWNMERIAQTIAQLDVAPRQVLIEAHVLTVTLSDDTKCGVNLQALIPGHSTFTLQTAGLADAAGFATPGAGQGFYFNLASNELNALISALTATANTKTLASPKVFAVNGQQAKIQIGGQLGFKETTTTQTSSLESVNFLNVGVILTVTPQITPDNRVLMKVKPEVSTGAIDPTSGLPNTTTTQVETSVLLPDGRGIVIGGLIQETNNDNQTKVPVLGDLWLVGSLFRYKETNRVRTEVIISLIPHIVPYQPACMERESQEFCRSATPLLYGALEAYPRPWEPSLPDACQCPWVRRETILSDRAAAPEPIDVPWIMQCDAAGRPEELPAAFERVPAPPGSASQFAPLPP
jgi:type IV pilus assembly protein PilQ